MLPFFAESLITVHALGAALGAAGVTFAELFYTQAVIDGKISSCEKKHIMHTLWALRWGVSITVFANVTLVLIEYFIPDGAQTVLTAPFWMQHTLMVIVLVCGILISRNAIPWWIGSSAAFTAWWMMLGIDLARNTPMNYIGLVVLYVILTLAVGAAFSYGRSVLHDRELRSQPS